MSSKFIRIFHFEWMRFESPIENTLDHLFRHEYGKLVSILTRYFGTENLELAEDVVQDTLLKAMDSWKLKGIPDNPTAWLLTSAKNKALDVLRRNRHHKKYASNLSPLLKSEYTVSCQLEVRLDVPQVDDEQLRMMFVCCHPSIPEESQVALILKTLCGFSIAEIAHAFFTNEETITKRLYRAKERFRESKVKFEFPDATEITARKEMVHTAIYLLFNEGYHASHSKSIIRDDLVEEALRLAYMLHLNKLTNSPETEALLALMCFHASRIQGKTSESGLQLQLKDQDRSAWNHELIEKGKYFLNRASRGNQLSAFHLEATIAYEYSIPPAFDQTNWKRIDQLYEILRQVKPGDMINFYHHVIKAEIYGAETALKGLAMIATDFLKSKPVFHLAKGDWLAKTGNQNEARSAYEAAFNLSTSVSERDFIQNKLKGIPSNT